MKYFMHLFVLMLFICVHPATDAFAQRGGVATIGDLLVYAGEIELKKGNIDAAVNEFSRALMAQPSNEKAARYLQELGHNTNVYRSHSAYMPQTSSAMSRMEIIAQQMNQVEAQRQDVQMHIAKTPSEGCADYYDGIDQRAGIITLCDGTKRFIKGWGARDSFLPHLSEETDSEVRVKKNVKGSSKGSPKGSGTVHRQNVRASYPEKIAHPQAAHIEASAPETAAFVMMENTDTADAQMMAKIRDTYHLEQQYDYEEFLRNQYFTSQEEVLNRSDIVDEQHMYLVKLHWELEESRNQIQHLLSQQENLLNYTTFEVQQMRENGRIE